MKKYQVGFDYPWCEGTKHYLISEHDDEAEACRAAITANCRNPLHVYVRINPHLTMAD